MKASHPKEREQDKYNNNQVKEDCYMKESFPALRPHFIPASFGTPFFLSDA